MIAAGLTLEILPQAHIEGDVAVVRVHVQSQVLAVAARIEIESKT